MHTTSLLTPRQLAVQLGVTTRTLANWRKAGVGPPAISVGRGGRLLRYRAESVAAWLDACEDDPATRGGTTR